MKFPLAAGPSGIVVPPFSRVFRLQLWNNGFAELPDHFKRPLVRRATRLPEAYDQVVGLDFLLPHLKLLQDGG